MWNNFNHSFLSVWALRGPLIQLPCHGSEAQLLCPTCSQSVSRATQRSGRIHAEVHRGQAPPGCGRRPSSVCQDAVDKKVMSADTATPLAVTGTQGRVSSDYLLANIMKEWYTQRSEPGLHVDGTDSSALGSKSDITSREFFMLSTWLTTDSTT